MSSRNSIMEDYNKRLLISIESSLNHKTPENDYNNYLIENFYRAKCVNYTGYIKGTGQLYTEVIADTLIRDWISEWKGIHPKRTGKKNHFDTGHTPFEDKDIEQLQLTTSKEKVLAKLLFYQGNIDGLGYVFDYETPLNLTLYDSCGAIDLISYNDKDNLISVVELKYTPTGSNETLLRCILEAYTYYRLFEWMQIHNGVTHVGLNELKHKYPDLAQKHDENKLQAELVILFDEASRTEADGGEDSNLMLRINSEKDAEVDDGKNSMLCIDSKCVDKARYPSKTVVSQQYKECEELLKTDKRNSLRTLCETILEQEPELKQIRFVVLRADRVSKAPYQNKMVNWSPTLDRSYRAETLLTISSKG